MAGEINNLGERANVSAISKKLVDLVHSERYIVTSFAKDIYLLILRELFSQNKGAFSYSDDPELTKLHISDRLEIPKEAQTVKPLIFLTRGRMGYSNLTIDNLASMDLNTGATAHTDLIRGSMIINCASGEGLEAEHLASLVFVLLASFKQKFMDIGFHNFSVGEILEERPIQADVNTKLVEVPVTTSFSFSYGWAISIMNSTPLEEINFSRAREAGPDNPYCSSETDECGNNIGVNGSGLDCGPFENIKLKGE